MKYLNIQSIRQEFLELFIKFKILLILLFFSNANISFASFFLEPSYNHYQGSFINDGETGDLTGQVLGLNMGHLGQHFMIGFTIETGKYSYDKNFTSHNSSQFDGGGIGTFVGFHFWNNLKIWTGYLNSTLEPTSNNDTRYFGQHFSYGLGYRIYEGLMINFYAFSNQFTQIEDDTTGKTTGLDSHIKTDGHNLSLSYMVIFN